MKFGNLLLPQNCYSVSVCILYNYVCLSTSVFPVYAMSSQILWTRLYVGRQYSTDLIKWTFIWMAQVLTRSCTNFLAVAVPSTDLAKQLKYSVVVAFFPWRIYKCNSVTFWSCMMTTCIYIEREGVISVLVTDQCVKCFITEMTKPFIWGLVHQS